MPLTISHVSCTYSPGAPSRAALDDVSLTVERGELVVVLGPTGSGKTTLLRVAAGLLPVVSGSVESDGLPVRGHRAQRGAVGLVFQRPEAQFFSLTVAEDCAFGPRNLGRSPAEAAGDVRTALLTVGLDPELFGPREPWSLSGGEARRAALAGVLAMKPRYLLLDEPTAGLDANGREAVCRAVEAARLEAGVVVVTHDPEVFVGSADRVIVLCDGRSVFTGDVAAWLEALLELGGSGAVYPPEVPRTLMLARERGLPVVGDLTLDAAAAATMLAEAVRTRAAGTR